jgi:hypothetical protein
MNILDLTSQAKRDFRPRETSVNLTTNKSFTLHNIHISFQYPIDPYNHASYSGGETKAAPAGCLSVHCMTFDVQLVYKGNWYIADLEEPLAI